MQRMPMPVLAIRWRTEAGHAAFRVGARPQDRPHYTVVIVATDLTRTDLPPATARHCTRLSGDTRDTGGLVSLGKPE